MGTISNGSGVGNAVEASEITFPLDVTRAAAVDDVITSKVTGDTQPRYVYNTDGKLEWGPGAAPLDTNFYRSTPNTLKTSGTLHVVEHVFVDSELVHRGTKVGFYNVAAIAKPTALTPADATAVDALYGEAEQKVIENLRTRVNELDTKIKALGLLT